MSAVIEKMFTDIMVKMLPPELVAKLTPENLQAIERNVRAEWDLVKMALATIGTSMNATHETVLLTQGMTADMAETLALVRASQERIEAQHHVGTNSNTSLPRKRPSRALTNGVGKH